MSKKLSSLYVSLGLDLTNFKKGMRELTGFQRTLSKAVTTLRTGALGFGGAYAISKVIQGLSARSWEFKDGVDNVKSSWMQLLDRGIKPVIPVLTTIVNMIGDAGAGLNRLLDDVAAKNKAQNFAVSGMFWSPKVAGTNMHPSKLDPNLIPGPAYDRPIGPEIGKSSREIQDYLKSLEKKAKADAEFSRFMQMQLSRGGLAPGIAGFEKTKGGVDYLARMAKQRADARGGIDELKKGSLSIAPIPEDVTRNFDLVRKEIERTEARFAEFAYNVKDDWARTIEGMLQGTVKFSQFTQQMLRGVYNSLVGIFAQEIAGKLFDAGSGLFRQIPGMSGLGGGTSLAGGDTVNIGTLHLSGSDARTLQAIINKNAKRRMY